ncbi:MAG TPA: leucine--tRNA ligase [Mycobacteriales bacterium]|nr:leucine--tRNA ligase [Mycobacteriales bacterium]
MTETVDSDRDPVDRDPVDRYDVHATESRWLAEWERLGLYRAGGEDDPRPRKYILDMFSYPSGDLHMGHAEAYSIGDVGARYWMMRGYNVMHPVGFDSFGLPAENAAIKRGLDPVAWTYANIETQSAAYRKFAVSFDWSRRLATSDPDYYRWTQWLFLRFFERGLAYRKASPVNWCPDDQTVLANEQVVAGRCERCHAVVTKRNLTQWYFRITDYADRLLDDMVELEGTWSDQVLTMQRNWIGRSVGAEVDFVIEGHDAPVTVFTTRPDTLFGATFFVVAVDSDLAATLAAGGEHEAAYLAYRDQVAAISEVERLATDRPKTGIFLGRYAVNPVNGERMPVWAADYVLADYGTGAIMAVPAHDQRDLDFARAFDLPVRVVINTAVGDASAVEAGTALGGDGTLVNSGGYDGLAKDEAIERITADLAAKGAGKKAINFRLRDWLISRQRYWGAPIPIVHCATCGEVAVPDDELPVRLPDSTTVDLAPKGISPLATAAAWLHVPCPKCGGDAQRDSDTMDTFVDSSWYFLRYCSPSYEDGPFDPAAVRRWMPVAEYTGGREHAILHLLYSRFFMKVLFDLGLVGCEEPFAALYNQGMVVMAGSKMSKSRGNLVNLGDELAAHGVDAVRVTMLFAGPPEEDIDWADVSPTGASKWLARVWRLAGEIGAAAEVDEAEDPPLRRTTHATIAEVTRLVESHRFNVAIARLMELTNALRKSVDAGHLGAPSVNEAIAALTTMLAVFAPYTAEECWARLGHEPSVHQQSWPVHDPALSTAQTVTCVVQVNGKLRDRVDVAPDVDEATLQELALATEGAQRAIAGAAVRTVVVRPPKLVNIVLG